MIRPFMTYQSSSSYILWVSHSHHPHALLYQLPFVTLSPYGSPAVSVMGTVPVTWSTVFLSLTSSGRASNTSLYTVYNTFTNSLDACILAQMCQSVCVCVCVRARARVPKPLNPCCCPFPYDFDYSWAQNGR